MHHAQKKPPLFPCLVYCMLFPTQRILKESSRPRMTTVGSVSAAGLCTDPETLRPVSSALVNGSKTLFRTHVNMYQGLSDDKYQHEWVAHKKAERVV